MRAAKPDELREYALPVLAANVSEVELRRWFPFPFEEITDPWAAAEPSKGALLQLQTGKYFVVYWGHDSQQLTVRIAPDLDGSDFLSDFFEEVPVLQTQVSWFRPGVDLPGPRNVSSGRARTSRVLIIEDDSSTVEALLRIVESEGLAADVVYDGERALSLLATRSYDVVLLDLGLPRLTGTEVMQYIKSTTPDLLHQVVVVTDLDVHGIRCLFPAVEFLSKPVMPGRIISAIQRRLGQSGGQSVSLVS